GTDLTPGFLIEHLAVTDSLTSIQEWLADTRLARQVTEALFHTCGRRHLARFDRLSAGRCQNRILLGLVHQARLTRFGLDHDFARIRTAADFRRLVPLSTGRDQRPGLVAPSPALQSSHRAALRTALALAAHERPRARLLAGNLLFLDVGWPEPSGA